MKDYGLEKQKIYIAILLNDQESFYRVLSILKSDYFDEKLKKIIDYTKKYVEKYKKLPETLVIKADLNIEGDDLDIAETITKEEVIGLREWFLEDFEYFCKMRALSLEVIKAAEKIQKGNFEGIDKNIREALLISINKSLGTNYFENPLSRITSLLDKSKMTPTGWKTIDRKLHGGLNRGEVTLFAGNSGMGKSLFLQNLAVNWSMMGLDVVYFTLELSEGLTALRLDAMFCNTSTKEVIKNREYIDKEILKIKANNNYGDIYIKYMNPGTTCNDLLAYLKEYEIQKGKRPDAIIIDYLDLMHPNNKRVDTSNLFVKDKYVSEELRSLANDLNLLCVSASQLNRSAVEEQFHDIADIAGGISKINTVDNVMTIYTSNAMKERGEYRVQFIKTRSSSGVGSSVLLKYCPISLRITDKEEAESKNNVKIKSTKEKIKNSLNKIEEENNKEYEKEVEERKNISEDKNKILDLIKRVKNN